MSFDRSLNIYRGANGAPSIKLGLKKVRDEFAGLDRLDRAELDEDEAVPSSPMTDRRNVA